MPPNPDSPRDQDEPSDPDDGLVHDEYTDPSLEGVDRLDALDVPLALRDVRVLEDIADYDDGIEEVDVLGADNMMDTIDTGARHRSIDEADMGLGAEPRTAEELEEASIGHALRGPGAVTRDDEVHGEALFDSQTLDDEADDEDAED